jgi:hypothetical protein
MDVFRYLKARTITNLLMRNLRKLNTIRNLLLFFLLSLLLY